MGLRIKQQKDRGVIYLYKGKEYIGSFTLKFLYQLAQEKKAIGRKKETVEKEPRKDYFYEGFRAGFNFNSRNNE